MNKVAFTSGIDLQSFDDPRTEIAKRYEVSSYVDHASMQIRSPKDSTASAARKIALIDSRSLTRDFFSKVLSESDLGLEVEAFSSVDALLSNQGSRADIVLLYSVDGYDQCIQQLQTVRAAFSDIPMIVLSDSAESAQPRYIKGLLQNGASGFISAQTTALNTALSAIHFVAAGGTFAPLEILLSEDKPTHQSDPAGPHGLTLRQQDVLKLVQQGKANKIIAHELGMSESTAKVHIRNIMRKMGATNRTQAAFNALNLESATS
jgi:DNA-binding NarL/FixJ family response regulator